MSLKPLADWAKEKWWAGLIALHAVKMFLWFRHIDFSSPFPVVNYDYIQYYARVLRAHEFLSRSGRFWGYNPFESAGVVTCFDVGTYLFGYICHWLSPLISIGRSLLFIEIIGLAITPVLALMAVQSLGGSRNQQWAAFGMSVFLFGALDPISAGVIGSGLFGYSVGSFFFVWFIGAILKWSDDFSWMSWTKAGLLGGISLLIHPAVAILMIPVFPILFLFHIRARRIRAAGSLFLLGSLILIMNWFWIEPYFHFYSWLEYVPYFQTTGQRYLAYLFSPLRSQIEESLRVVVLGFIFYCSLAALRGWYKSRSDRFWVLSITLLWMGFIFSFGSSFSFFQTSQPGRVTVPFWILVGSLSAWNLAEDVQNNFKNKKWIFPIGVATTICFVFTLTNANPKRILMSNKMGPSEQALVSELMSLSPSAGRVLLESTNIKSRPNISDLIPSLTRHSVLGGPDTGIFLKTRFSMFSGAYGNFDNKQSYVPVVFNRALASLSEEDLKFYLDLYNVAWVVAYTPSMKEQLGIYPNLVKLKSNPGSYSLYEVNHQPNWFIKGSGDVSFDYDKIQIKNASAGEIILKFHWIQNLNCDPPIAIRPVIVNGSPMPFISIDNSSGYKEIYVENP